MQIHNKIGRYLQPGRAWYTRELSQIKKLVVHHDAIPHDNRTQEQISQAILKTHANNGWPGHSYHFMIHRDGSVYQINDLRWVVWHDTHNWDSVGILLTGYFHPPHNNAPTKAQLAAMHFLLQKLQKDFKVPTDSVLGHRQRSATACPGDHLYHFVHLYRLHKGNVDWGHKPEPTCEEKLASANRELQEKQAKITAQKIGLGNAEFELGEKGIELSRLSQDFNEVRGRLEETADNLAAKTKELEEVDDKYQKALETQHALTQSLTGARATFKELKRLSGVENEHKLPEYLSKLQEEVRVSKTEPFKKLSDYSKRARVESVLLDFYHRR